ncbi:FkbM family methyltransferase [archaeon]|nr:MAG: FkbM family methyltransferase [archaeon]
MRNMNAIGLGKRRVRFYLVILALIIVVSLTRWLGEMTEPTTALWIVNAPSWFRLRDSSLGHLHSVVDNPVKMQAFQQLVDKGMQTLSDSVDGENVDAIEHFFWGMTNGVAMELGALDGSRKTRSMTLDLEEYASWKRILIEGNPKYRHLLLVNSPNALSISAAICEKQHKVHFVDEEFTGGIVEFMQADFIKKFHHALYSAYNPPGDMLSMNWSSFNHVTEVDCLPLSMIFQEIAIEHVNLFILDVEGGEFRVLQSIPWSKLSFDVLCVEVDPSLRPDGYANQITQYLAEKGYVPATGLVGRNICKCQ